MYDNQHFITMHNLSSHTARKLRMHHVSLPTISFYTHDFNILSSCAYYLWAKYFFYLLFKFLILNSSAYYSTYYSNSIIIYWQRKWQTLHHLKFIVNPRHACAARVTVLGRVCVCVCVSVYLLSHISPLERPFVLKILSCTKQAMEVKKFVGFSLKPLHSEVMTLFAYLQHPTAILQRYSTQLFDGRAFLSS